MPVPRREFMLALLAGAAGAGLVVLAARQAWAHAVFTPPRPLPAQDIAVTGQQLVPLASALALAALACLAAVIATRSGIRRAVGVLLAVIGAGAAAAASAGLRASTVLAAAQEKGAGAVGGTLGGSTTSGAPSGGAVHEIVVSGSGRVIQAGAPWQAAAVAGAVVIMLVGLATVWRGPRWPAMSSRYERSRREAPTRASTDSASMWESLSHDVDPTVDDRTRG